MSIIPAFQQCNVEHSRITVDEMGTPLPFYKGEREDGEMSGRWDRTIESMKEEGREGGSEWRTRE